MNYILNCVLSKMETERFCQHLWSVNDFHVLEWNDGFALFMVLIFRSDDGKTSPDSDLLLFFLQLTNLTIFHIIVEICFGNIFVAKFSFLSSQTTEVLELLSTFVLIFCLLGRPKVFLDLVCLLSLIPWLMID